VGAKGHTIREIPPTRMPFFLKPLMMEDWHSSCHDQHIGKSKEGTMSACRTTLTATSLVVLTLLCAPAIHAQAPPQPPKTVTGQVAAVEGEFRMAKDHRGEDIFKMVDTSYLVTTQTGQQIELKLTRETKVPARANPGDRIEAKVTDKGQTLSVKLIEDAGDFSMK
jgi:hypothetical protein